MAAPDLSIVNLRGGQNDTDSPSALADNQVVLAQNVEFFYSALGERRCGCEPLMDMTGSGLENTTAVVHVSQWFPGNQIVTPSLLAVGMIPSVSAPIAIYGNGVWTPLTPSDPVLPNLPNVYNIQSQDLNGKDFIAYPSGADRLHVYDGTTLRRTGLAEPQVPGAVDITGAIFSFLGGVSVGVPQTTATFINVPIGDSTGASLAVLVIVAEAFAALSLSVSDNQGNPWNKRISLKSADNNTLVLQVWDSYLAARVGPGHVVSIRAALATGFSANISKWAGPSTVDQTAGSTGSGTSVQGGTVTPTALNELVISAVAVGKGGAGSFPYSVNQGLSLNSAEILPNPNTSLLGLGVGSIIETAIIAKNPTWTWTGTDTQVAAANITYALSGAAGISGLRYYRIRYLTINSNFQTLLKSEPGPSVAHTPGGGAIGVTITRPPLLGEAETHWVLEGSLDNSTFYVISAPIPIATTTLNDTVTPASYSSYPQSEAVGLYLTQPSAKYLSLDGDRLLLGGHWTDPTQQSRVSWTPVLNDPGFGNDERIPLTSNNFFDLENFTGGPLTGISTCGYGNWYAFKWSRIYQLTRSGNVTNAYNLQTISTEQGAIPGSIVAAYDELGNPCIYFLEPTLGPCRIGVFGLTVLKGLRTTWARLNSTSQNIIARVVHYPFKNQIHWWLAADNSTLPSLKIVLQINLVGALQSGGTGGCWSLATGRIAQALTATVFTEQAFVNGTLTLSSRPVIGLTAPDFIQRCDVGSDDAGVPYSSTLTTKPYFQSSLLSKWGVMAAEFLATAVSGVSIVLSCIRDFGKETNSVTAALDPKESESEVIVVMDDLEMSDAKVVQFSFTDPT